jgi:phosphate acetyltransferase
MELARGECVTFFLNCWSSLFLFRRVTSKTALLHAPDRPASPKHKASSLYIHSTEPGSGKALVVLGVMDLVLSSTWGTSKVGFFRPIIGRGAQQDEDTALVLEHFKLKQTMEESYGMRSDEASQLLGEHRLDHIVEVIIEKYKALEAKCDFILCEGRHGSNVEFNLSVEMAKNLACPVMILGSAKDRTVQEAVETIQIAVERFNAHDADIVGVVLNKADPSHVLQLSVELDNRFKNRGFIHTVIPYDERLSAPRVSDVVEALGAQVLYGQQCLDNKVICSILGTTQLQHVLDWIRKDGCLVFTSGDRGDIIVGAMLAHSKSHFPASDLRTMEVVPIRRNAHRPFFFVICCPFHQNPRIFLDCPVSF